ncbi:autotransporter domain-containing protein [Planctomycetota bacterium]|nr:autotransporter domain-containing protein [Planctomycetota bacterium]
MGRFTKHSRGVTLTTTALITAWFCMGGSSFADTLEWNNDAAGNHNWSDEENWNTDETPSTGDVIRFDTTQNSTYNESFVDGNFDIDNLVFGPGTNLVDLTVGSGNTLTIDNISNSSDNAQTIKGESGATLKAGDDLVINGDIIFDAADGDLDLANHTLDIRNTSSLVVDVDNLDNVKDIELGNGSSLSLKVGDDSTVTATELDMSDNATLKLDGDYRMRFSGEVEVEENSTFILDNDAELVLDGQITEDESTDIEMTFKSENGARGTVYINNSNNSYNGDVILENTKLVIGNDNVLGDVDDNDLIIRDGGGLATTGDNELENDVTVDSGDGSAMTMTYDDDGELELSGDVAFDADGVTLNNRSLDNDEDDSNIEQNGTLILSGTTSGGALTITGNGVTRFEAGMTAAHASTDVNSGVLVNDLDHDDAHAITQSGTGMVALTDNSLDATSGAYTLDATHGLASSNSKEADVDNVITNEIIVDQTASFFGDDAITLSGDATLDDGAGSTVEFDVVNDMKVIMNGNIVYTNANGEIIKKGEGELQLNSSTDAIVADLTVNEGELQIGGAGLIGDIVIKDEDKYDATLILGANEGATIGGAANSITINNGSVIDLAADNQIVSSGTINLEDTAGTIKFINDDEVERHVTFEGDIDASSDPINKTFDIDENSNVVLSGQIIDTNYLASADPNKKIEDFNVINFTKTGQGTLTIGNDTTVYGGNLSVNAGELYLNGQGMEGDVNVSSGATFGGIGLVDGNLTLNGGLHDPGSAEDQIGTQRIDGNYNASNSLIEIDLDSDTDQHDKIEVIGGDDHTTNISGARIYVDVLGDGTLEDGDEYTIIKAADEDEFEAGGVTFDDNLYFVTFTGEVDDDEYKIIVNAQYDYEGTAQGDNTSSLANSVNEWFTDDVDGDRKEVIDTLNISSSQKIFNDEIKKLSPAPLALSASTAFESISSQSNHVAGRMAGLRTGTGAFIHQTASNSNISDFADDPDTLALAIDTPTEIADWFNQKDYAVWGNINGVYSNQDTTQDRLGYQGYTANVILGADTKVNENLILGVLGSFGQSKVDFNDDIAQTDITSIRSGVYGSYYLTPNIYFDSIASLGYNWNESTRNIEIGDVDSEADSEFTSFDASLYTGVGYEMKLGSFSFVPNAWIQYTYYSQEEITEEGAGNIGTNIDEYNTNSLRTQIGAKFTRFMEYKGRPFVPEFSIGWAHEWLEPYDMDATFIGDDTPFTYNPGITNEDAYLLGLGVTTLLNERTSFFTKYDGEFGDDGSVHGLTLGLKVKF